MNKISILMLCIISTTCTVAMEPKPKKGFISFIRRHLPRLGAKKQKESSGSGKKSTLETQEKVLLTTWQSVTNSINSGRDSTTLDPEIAAILKSSIESSKEL